MHSVPRNFNQEEQTIYWTPIMGYVLCIFYLLKTLQLLCLMGMLSTIYK